MVRGDLAVRHVFSRVCVCTYKTFLFVGGCSLLRAAMLSALNGRKKKKR